MMRYSVQPRYQIYVKGYWFLSFAKNMVKPFPQSLDILC